MAAGGNALVGMSAADKKKNTEKCMAPNEGDGTWRGEAMTMEGNSDP